MREFEGLYYSEANGIFTLDLTGDPNREMDGEYCLITDQFSCNGSFCLDHGWEPFRLYTINGTLVPEARVCISPESQDGAMDFIFKTGSYENPRVGESDYEVTQISDKQYNGAINNTQSSSNTENNPNDIGSDTSQSLNNIDNNELMDTIMFYYAAKYGTNNVAAEIDHESGDSVEFIAKEMI